MRTRRLLAITALLPLVLAACGDDADEASGTSTTTKTGVHSDESHGGEKECTPVGEDLEARATRTISVELKDYLFSPAASDTAAGVVTFAATNAGSQNHELAFLPGGGDVPMTPEGKPDEDALEQAGAFELEAFGPGQTCNATYELAAGKYTLFCIVTSDDGKTHYDKGMRGELVVS